MTEDAAGRAGRARAAVATLDDRVELTAPAHPESLDLVHSLLEHLWTTHPEVGDVDRGRFETALIEVLANIVEHAYRHDPARGRRVDLQLGLVGSGLVAHLADNGLPAELDMSAVSMPDPLSESGRGLALATAALDDLSYEREGGRNHWTLLCLLAED